LPEERYEERTIPATPRKRQEARERGYVCRSIDLSAAFILLSAVIALNFLGDGLFTGLRWIYTYFLSNLNLIEVSRDTAQYYAATVLQIFIMVYLPILIIVFVVALAINILQVGFIFTAYPFGPHLERLNPFTGILRIFSMRMVVRLILHLLRLVIIAAVVYKTLWDERTQLMMLFERELSEIVCYIAKVIFIMSIRVALVLLILALIDYAYQRYRYERDLMMSRLEFQEELKRYEGDPRVRRRRLEVHRQLILQRMYARVPEATVTITNPTLIAVALQYNEDLPAPRCVAKGTDEVARRIIEISREHDIPIFQNPPLAQALYKMVGIGQFIPEQLYKAVAEIIGFVFRLKGREVRV
jgi:flagellar biosynthetic protein FlhB